MLWLCLWMLWLWMLLLRCARDIAAWWSSELVIGVGEPFTFRVCRQRVHGGLVTAMMKKHL